MSQKLSHLQYADWLERSLQQWLPESQEHSTQGESASLRTRMQLIETPKIISLRGVVLHKVAISYNFDLSCYQNHELCQPTITGLCLEDDLPEARMAEIKDLAKSLLWEILWTEKNLNLKEQLDKILLKGEVEKTGTQLQKIIFLLKEKESSQEDMISSDFPSSHRLDKKENSPAHFESQPVNSFFNAKNIPSPINTPPTIGAYKNIRQSLYDLIYVFSDGVQLNLNEVHFHPHAKLLHKDLLPSKITLSHLDPYIKTFERTEINRNKYASALSILWNAFKTRQQHRIDIDMGIETTQNLHIFPVQNISFAQTAQHALPQERLIGSQKKVQGTHFDLSLKMLRSQQKASTISFNNDVFAEKICFLNGFYDREHNHLYFHPFSSFIHRYIKLQEGSPCLPRLKENWFEIDLTQFDSVSPAINELQNICERHSIDFRVSQDSTTVPHSKITPHYFFEENHCLPTCKIELSDGPIWLSNLTGFQHSLLKILAEGFKAFPNMKESQIRSRRKDIIRDMDMRVFKHRGLAFLFVREFTHWLMQNRDNVYNNKQVNEPIVHHMLDIVFEKMAKVVFNSSTIPSMPRKSSLKGICSHLVIQNLTEGTMELIKQAFTPVNFLYKKRLYQIHEAHLIHLPFMRGWLDNISEVSRDQSLNRQNKSFTPPIDSPPNFYIGTSEQKGYSYPLLRDEEMKKWVLSPWRYCKQEDNVVCFYKGLEVHFITDQNFSGSLKLTQQENQGIDWFALNPEFFLNKEEISPDQIYQLLQESALKHQGKFYVLNESGHVPTLRALQWFWRKVHRTQIDGRARFLLPRHQVLDLLALRATGISINGDDRWKQICEFYDNLDKPRKPIQLPKSFQAQLKPYQDNGLHWILDLYQLGLGGILADDMGLGKTVQALSFFELLRSRKQLGHSLVIVPTSLTYNWISEGEKFTPELPIVRFSSKEKDQIEEFLAQNPQAVVITTYGLLSENQDFFTKPQWNIHIYDEAQNLKNITAKRTAAAKQTKANFKLCLTGTPLENHYGELYSLMDLIVPGSLGDLSDFKKIFVSSNQVQDSQIKHLKLQIKPLILRRTKDQILKDLPAKTEILLKIPFSEKQKAIYKDLALSWNKKVKDSMKDGGEGKSQIIMLTALLRLRQACSDPASIPNVIYPDLPPKISTLTNSIDEIIQNKDSALVFTQFLTTLQRLENELKQKGVPVFVLHGSLNQKKREEALRAFNEREDGAVLIMTLKTGGTGLNLTKASYVFHLEPWWNPAVENQATDRAHRIGQTKPITVYRYLMKESIEEKVEILKERKASKFSALFNETEEASSSPDMGSQRISKEDFEYLLNSTP